MKAREVILNHMTSVMLPEYRGHLEDVTDELIGDILRAGFVILPKEPTDSMVSAGAFYHYRHPEESEDVPIAETKASYRAMRDAYLKGEGV
jgi:hypothetical protein